MRLRPEDPRTRLAAAQAAPGAATVEQLSPSEAPGAPRAAAIARHCIGLPEQEGVGER